MPVRQPPVTDLAVRVLLDSIVDYAGLFPPASVSMATASYESDELRAMAGEIEQKGLQFLNECGLDPGLDHMSAMKVMGMPFSKAFLVITRTYFFAVSKLAL